MHNENKKLIIYGAGLMGRNLQKVISEVPYCKKIECFIVKSKKNNPDKINGVNVIEIGEALQYRDNVVFVALHEKNIKSGIEDLKQYGFLNLIPVSFDNDTWSVIRENWIKENEIIPYGVKILKEQKNNKLHIYVIKNENDKKLKDIPYYTDYEIPIQVGKQIASKKICEIGDNSGSGENISKKNLRYCELTGLFWVWKNDSAEYIGICHYRRRFVIGINEFIEINNQEYDMYVTTPILNLNSVKNQYEKDHDIKDWDVMAKVINEYFTEYVQALDEVSNGRFYFGYNMFIAKKNILNDYCSWLFKILDLCENLIGEKKDKYQNRYAGFLAERLLTVYIAKHKELRVRVIYKHFIESE